LKKKPKLIAEIGINHNGSIKIAKDLILQAKRSNFDYVKFQKRDLDTCIPETLKNEIKSTPWGTMTYFKYKKKIEFNRIQFDQLVKFCKSIDIKIMCSAWDIKSFDFLKKYKLKLNKIPSALLTNYDFLEYVAKEKVKTLISTGMSNINEIKNAVKIFQKNKCKFVLMHCVSEYPCPENKLNLNLISFLKKKFKCEVGYSGHESTVSPSFFAWALGASYIERHITLDRAMWGTDQSASLEENGMKLLSEILNKAPKFFGNGIKKISRKEKEILKKFKYWN
jgi:N-acetylneuraminate synthase